MTGKEYKIPSTNYRVDGYLKGTNIVFEFNGDFFHGNPSLFKADDWNSLCKNTYGQLYENTKNRERIITE